METTWQRGNKLLTTPLCSMDFPIHISSYLEGAIPWGIAIILFASAAGIFLASLQIPDVPPISDSQFVDSLGEIDQNETITLGAGWEQNTEATFAVLEVEIVTGTLVHGYWEYDSDGENCSDYVDVYDDVTLTVKPTSDDNSEIFQIRWSDEIGTVDKESLMPRIFRLVH